MKLFIFIFYFLLAFQTHAQNQDENIFAQDSFLPRSDQRDKQAAAITSQNTQTKSVNIHKDVVNAQKAKEKPQEITVFLNKLPDNWHFTQKQNVLPFYVNRINFRSAIRSHAKILIRKKKRGRDHLNDKVGLYFENTRNLRKAHIVEPK